MADLELLNFLRKKDKDDVATEELDTERQCPHCGEALGKESFYELEYTVDGILNCPSCDEVIEE